MVNSGRQAVVGEERKEEVSLEMNFVRSPPNREMTHVGSEVVGSVREKGGVSPTESGEVRTSHHSEDGDINEQGSPPQAHNSGAWSDGFLPRSSIEQTRNCSRVDRNLQQFIVDTLTKALLSTERWIELDQTTPTPPSTARTPAYSYSSTDSSVYCTTRCSGTAIREGKNENLKMSFPFTMAATPGNDVASYPANWGSPSLRHWNLGGNLIIGSLTTTDVIS